MEIEAPQKARNRTAIFICGNTTPRDIPKGM
jgi:hypothetical protein